MSDAPKALREIGPWHATVEGAWEIGEYSTARGRVHRFDDAWQGIVQPAAHVRAECPCAHISGSLEGAAAGVVSTLQLMGWRATLEGLPVVDGSLPAPPRPRLRELSLWERTGASSWATGGGPGFPAANIRPSPEAGSLGPWRALVFGVQDDTPGVVSEPPSVFYGRTVDEVQLAAEARLQEMGWSVGPSALPEKPATPKKPTVEELEKILRDVDPGVAWEAFKRACWRF